MTRVCQWSGCKLQNSKSAREQRRKKAWKEFGANKQWLCVFHSPRSSSRTMPLPDAWGSTGYILGSDQNIKYCDGSVSQTYTLALASPRLAAATSSTGMDCFYPDDTPPPKKKKLICWPWPCSPLVLKKGGIINRFTLTLLCWKQDGNCVRKSSPPFLS